MERNESTRVKWLVTMMAHDNLFATSCCFWKQGELERTTTPKDRRVTQAESLLVVASCLVIRQSQCCTNTVVGAGSDGGLTEVSFWAGVDHSRLTHKNNTPQQLTSLTSLNGHPLHMTMDINDITQWMCALRAPHAKIHDVTPRGQA